MAKPFAGIRVLDLTHVLAGPFCAWQFALLGADVIKIENPADPDCARARGPDATQNTQLNGLTYQVQGTNKRAIALDLKKSEGLKVLLDLVRTADVLIENYRPGALLALGAGYHHLAAVNPSLIYCSISGFGEEGPRAGLHAYDNTIQAASGIISQSGGHKPGVSFVDYATGYSAAFAVSAALLRREKEGKGVHITCSMFETALMLMAPELAASLTPSDAAPGKEAGLLPYQTQDGILMLGAFTPEQNHRMWQLLAEQGFDVGTFGQCKTFAEMWSCAPAMRAALSDIMATKTAAEWQELLHARGIAAERVRSLREAAADPQLAARGFFHSEAGGAAGALFPTTPCRWSEDGPSIEAHAPAVGEHTDLLLSELGVEADAIVRLRTAGAVA
ncbi:CaiB/BaiF CoA transferase family protein [Agaricicola taiwanensis]|uniref:CaiB/BaiF CoA transferase family protein n=1 Tax=Agaricicola taiwanensis TaxID=591372 RepID=UPI001E455721|nr:CaiB/BaiF CoA-transferase family protein [Agaricicola taiwanensis]